MIEICDIRDPQSSHNRDIRDSLFRETRENRGMDGPTEIQRWLSGNLAEMGHGAKGRLADYMGVRPDAVTRMLNWEPGKERRVIDAEHLVKMSEFFGKVPPGRPAVSAPGRRSSGDRASDRQVCQNVTSAQADQPPPKA